MATRLAVATYGAALLMACAVAAQECDTFQECMAGMCQDGLCMGEPLTGGSCDDGNSCTTNDTCVSGVCMGTPKTAGADCDDHLDCTLDDKCTMIGNGLVCLGLTPADGGTPCEGGCGTCQQGVPLCQLTEGKLNQTCTPLLDLGPCIVGKCTVVLGTQFALCSPMPKQCPDVDGDPCTGEFCDPHTGECATAPVPARLDCFPAECHRCVGDGQCVPANAGNSCDDLNVCTDSTVCQSDGTCRAGAPPQTATPTATVTHTATQTQTGVNTATPSNTVAANTATPTRTQGTPAPTATTGRCVGDCNHNGMTVVNEVVTGVNIALDRAPITSCPEFDVSGNQKVEVNELVSGVNSLLHGCVAAAALR